MLKPYWQVEKILVENNKAAGVRLSDGNEYMADFVISDADGRKTIMQMLEGKYTDERIRALCAEPPDETNWAVHVFLGVNRDLSKEPSALVMLLDSAQTVIDILENHFPGIKSQVEEIDVPTLMTWERYMGGTHGFANMPNKKLNIIASLLGRGEERTLPGLSGFYFVGAWATSTGALFSNAYSGKKVIKAICSDDGRSFSCG